MDLAAAQLSYNEAVRHATTEDVDRNDSRQLHELIDTKHDIASTTTYYADHRHRVIAANREHKAQRHRTLRSAHDDTWSKVFFMMTLVTTVCGQTFLERLAKLCNEQQPGPTPCNNRGYKQSKNNRKTCKG